VKKAVSSTFSPLQRIAVLYGGNSSERDVSLASGSLVLDELRGLGVDAIPIRLDDSFVEPIVSAHADAFLIALHGGWGEDGRVQALLELMQMPYSGSRSFPSALAMNKDAAKSVFRAKGLLTPDWEIVRSKDELADAIARLGVPLILKPISEGSSIGLELLESPEHEPVSGPLLAQYGEMLAERFIEGRILTVTVLDVPPDPRSLCPLEIVPTKARIYDREAKREGYRDYVVKPNLPAAVLQYVSRVGWLAHRSLGCSGISRVDLVHTPADETFVLEVNTVPGMGPTGNLVTTCEAQGISRRDLVQMLVNSIR
jgi:D-alanine-D-alanine ligase